MGKSKVLALCAVLCSSGLQSLGEKAGLSYSVLAGKDGIAVAVFLHLTYHVDLPCWLYTAYLWS